MVCAKVRIRFRKNGDLRFISHHDLMRCFERMLRRAALPFHCTAGFNPKPRLVFPSPLPLGVAGSREVAELELDQDIPALELHDRLASHAPPGLEIIDVQRIDGKKTAHARLACYRIPLQPDQADPGLPERILAILEASTCWVERRRPQPRRLDLRPYIQDVRLLPGALEMDLVITPSGTARPEEVLGLLGLANVLETGAVVERTRLELDGDHSEANTVPSDHCAPRSGPQ